MAWLEAVVFGNQWGLQSSSPPGAMFAEDHVVVCDTALVYYGGQMTSTMSSPTRENAVVLPDSFFGNKLHTFDLRSKIWRSFEGQDENGDRPGVLTRGTAVCIEDNYFILGGREDPLVPTLAMHDVGLGSGFAINMEELVWRRTSSASTSGVVQASIERFSSGASFAAGTRVFTLSAENTPVATMEFGHIVRVLKEASSFQRGDASTTLPLVRQSLPAHMWVPPKAGNVFPINACGFDIQGGQVTPLCRAEKDPETGDFTPQFARKDFPRDPCKLLFHGSTAAPGGLKLPPVLMIDTFRHFHRRMITDMDATTRIKLHIPGTRLSIWLSGLYSSFAFVHPVLVHVDTLWSCRLPLAPDSLRPLARHGASGAIVKVPVYQVAQVTTAGNGSETVWGSPPASSGNRPLLMGWRTVLVVIYGCPSSPSRFACNWPQNLEQQRGLGTSQTWSRNRTTPGAHSGEVWTLDLTPLLENAPRSVRIGFDPRVAQQKADTFRREKEARGKSPEYYGQQQKDIYERRQPSASPAAWAWYHTTATDAELVGNISQVVSDTCSGWRNLSNDVAPPWAQQVYQTVDQPLDFEESMFSSTSKARETRPGAEGRWNRDEPRPPDELTCKNIPPLRWSKVAAAGIHVQPTDEGLRIALPPRDTAWVSWYNIMNGEPTDAAKPTVVECRNTEWKEELQAMHAQLSEHLPTLVVPSANQLGTAWELVSTQAVGRAGPLSSLGAATILSFMGRRSVVLGSGSQLLELFATVPRPVTHSSCGYQTAWDTDTAEASRDPLLTRSQSPLDDKVVFWGTWTASETPSGSGPWIQHSAGVADIPVPTHALALSSLFPEIASDLELSDDVLTNAAALVQRSVRFWEWIVQHQNFGPFSGGFDVAFLSHTGHGRYIDDALRIANKISRVKIRNAEKWLVIAGGCQHSAQEIFHLGFCIKWEITVSHSPSAQELQESIGLELSEVKVFDPATVSWVPSSLHRIPPLPRSMHYHALVDIGSGLLTIGGAQTGSLFTARPKDGFITPLTDQILFFEWLGPEEWQMVNVTYKSIVQPIIDRSNEVRIVRDATKELLLRIGASATVQQCPVFVDIPGLLEACVWVVGGQYLKTLPLSTLELKTVITSAQVTIHPDIVVIVLYRLQHGSTLQASVWAIDGGGLPDTPMDHPVADNVPLVGESIRGCFGAVQTTFAIQDQLFILGGGVLYTRQEGNEDYSDWKAWRFLQKNAYCRIDLRTGIVVSMLSNLRGDNVAQVSSAIRPCAHSNGRTVILSGGTFTSSFSLGAYALDTLTNEVIRLSNVEEPQRQADFPPFQLVTSEQDDVSGMLSSSASAWFASSADLARPQLQAPFDRGFGACIWMYDRQYIVGGFSSVLGSIVSEVVVFQPSMKTKSVLQTFPTQFMDLLTRLSSAFALPVGDTHHGASTPPESIITQFCKNAVGGCEDLLSNVRSAVDNAVYQDVPCMLYEAAPCGTFHAAAAFVSAATTSQQGQTSVRNHIVLKSPLVLSPTKLAHPVVIRPDAGVVNAAWVLCDLPQGLNNSCISVQTGTGASPPPSGVLSIRGVRSLPLHIIEQSLLNKSHFLATPHEAQPFLACDNSAVELAYGLVLGFGEGNISRSSDSSLGGGLRLVECGASLQGMHISHCSSSQGGAIGSAGGFIRLIESMVSHNRASTRGGGLFISCGDGFFENTVFEGNTVIFPAGTEENGIDSRHGGGAIYCIGERALDFHGGRSTFNAATSPTQAVSGGAVRAVFCNVNLHNHTMEHNVASGGGGGVHATFSRLTTSHSVFSSNSARGKGGALLCENCEGATLVDTTFTGNRVASALVGEHGEGVGGGCAIVDAVSSVGIRNAEFINNHAATYGGGLFIETPSSASALPPSVDCSGDVRFSSNDTEHGYFITKLAAFDKSCYAVVDTSVPSARIQVSGPLLFVNNSAEAGGGAFTRGVNIPTLFISDAEEEWMDNSAVYGVKVGSEPRSLGLLGQLSDFVLLPHKCNRRAVARCLEWAPWALAAPYMTMKNPPAVVLLDGYGQRILTSSSVVVANALSLDCLHSWDAPCGSCLGLMRGAIGTLDQGIAVFPSLTVLAEPHSTFLLWFQLEEADIQLLTSFACQLRSKAEEEIYQMRPPGITSEIIMLRVPSCPPGREFLVDLGCRPCPSGTFSSNGGPCLPCAPGSFSEPGSPACLWCLPGTFAKEEGSSLCLDCPGGVFAGPAQSSCTPCPKSTVCNRGIVYLPRQSWLEPSFRPTHDTSNPLAIGVLTRYYQRYRSLPLSQLPCIPPALLVQLSMRESVLPPIQDFILTVMPRLQDATNCTEAASVLFPKDVMLSLAQPTDMSVQVKETALVRDGRVFLWWLHTTHGTELKTASEIYSQLALVTDLTSFFSAAAVSNISRESVFHTCLHIDACHISSDSQSLECAEAFTGPLCALCIPGWAQLHPASACFDCGGVNGWLGVPYLLVVALVITWILVSLHQWPPQRREIFHFVKIHMRKTTSQFFRKYQRCLMHRKAALSWVRKQHKLSLALFRLTATTLATNAFLSAGLSLFPRALGYTGTVPLTAGSLHHVPFAQFPHSCRRFGVPPSRHHWRALYGFFRGY